MGAVVSAFSVYRSAYEFNNSKSEPEFHEYEQDGPDCVYQMIQYDQNEPGLILKPGTLGDPQSPV